MSEQNQTMDFQSNLRNIFLTWRDYSRRSIRLANAIKSVIQKSLQIKGFEMIREFAKQDETTQKKMRMIAKIRRMFWKANCGYAMSIWRQTEFI